MKVCIHCLNSNHDKTSFHNEACECPCHTEEYRKYIDEKAATEIGIARFLR